MAQYQRENASVALAHDVLGGNRLGRAAVKLVQPQQEKCSADASCRVRSFIHPPGQPLLLLHGQYALLAIRIQQYEERLADAFPIEQHWPID